MALPALGLSPGLPGLSRAASQGATGRKAGRVEALRAEDAEEVTPSAKGAQVFLMVLSVPVGGLKRFADNGYQPAGVEPPWPPVADSSLAWGGFPKRA